MTFNGPIGGLIDFAIGGGWGSEVPKENHSRVAVIRGTDIPKVASGEFSTVPFRYESDKKILNRILAPGDVVLETAGGSSANGQYTGRTLLITQEILDVLGPTICASFCKKLVLNKDLVSPSYFYFYMQDLYKSGRVAAYDSQSTGISNFQYEAFVNNELLELPKLEIQTSVASVLVNLQSKINNNSKISKTLEEIAQTIFKSWFINFEPVKAKMAGEKPVGMDAATTALFPDSMEESEIGLIPSGWDVKPAADLFEVGIGRTPPRKEPQWFCKGNEGIPWVSIRDMGTFETYSHGTSEGLTKAAVDKFKVPVVPENTVLMSFKLTVGKLCISDTDLVTNEAIAHFKISQNSPLNSFYTYLSLSNLDMGSLDSTSSIGTATNSGVIKQIRFLVPPQELLGIFYNKVSPIFSQLELLRKQTTNLVLLRDSLLPRLISGELQIPEEMLAS